MSKHKSGIDASAVVFAILASAFSGFIIGFIFGVSIGVFS